MLNIESLLFRFRTDLRYQSNSDIRRIKGAGGQGGKWVLLDTIDISEIEKCLAIFPISGITSNPSIIKQYGKVDFFSHFKDIRSLIGAERSLHIQMVSEDADGILAEAYSVLEKIDHDVFIKIPVTEQGLKAIQILKMMQWSPLPPFIRKHKRCWRPQRGRIIWRFITTGWKTWISIPAMSYRLRQSYERNQQTYLLEPVLKYGTSQKAFEAGQMPLRCLPSL